MVNKKQSKKGFYQDLKEAQKDPKFKKELEKFIKITTKVYKLKDFGLE